MSEAPSCNIKLVPLNPSKTKVVGKTGMTREKKDKRVMEKTGMTREKKDKRVRLPTQGMTETGRTQFLLQESILYLFSKTFNPYATWRSRPLQSGW